MRGGPPRGSYTDLLAVCAMMMATTWGGVISGFYKWGDKGAPAGLKIGARLRRALVLRPASK